MSIDKKTYDMLRKSIVKIEYNINVGFTKNGERKKILLDAGKGTGFICDIKNNEAPFLITVGHVITDPCDLATSVIDTDSGKKYLTSNDIELTRIFTFYVWKNDPIKIVNPKWLLHNKYDIAALSVNRIISQAKQNNTPLDYECVSSAKIVDFDFIQSKNSIPISIISTYAEEERGYISGISGKTVQYDKILHSKPEKDPKKDIIAYSPQTHFLIDADCINGDSGSPVYMDNGENLIGIVSVNIKSDTIP